MKGNPTTTSAAPLPYPQTPESANAWFVTHGINKSAWARELGIDRMTMVDLLRGRLKGLRGDAHHAAVALGLKANPTQTHQAA
ncbi:DNA-binding protein [Pseudomonas aeruginosa]|jgi:gp16 family phage-associated protein|uniref:Phage-associated protein, BcepMu gp16 family n=1 Tax=Pseudomonas sihuiensis TaxID=1274359 RepID=A0A1H2L2V8_9PSED|nr:MULTISPECIES: DNA-binding protein [Pseudomonas]MBG6673516.1 DNA-binding protein [Pseudomonas aeruginosa]MBG6741533.1 DNA-binding protein [Pseudomonas aeruginosa]MBG6858465.1 DNA-binding protein [Pseudomonas aeruginosa]MBI8442843.1 DNA-binding protein [Pseudomonas aeruginosa]MDH1281028.1 DNA-binding protein [Pseudomonas chengduensis]